jgi:ABC-type sugar transport system substrate-binding protein
VSSKILVSLPSEAQEFQVMQAEDARETGARLGPDVEVVFAASNAVAQIQQLFKAIHAPEGDRPAAIIVEPCVGEAFGRVARNAVRAGVGWFLVNLRAGYIDELRSAYPEAAVTMVGVDQVEVGRIQGRQCRAFLPDGGRVLGVHGPVDSSATHERAEGFAETAGEGFELRTLHGDWTAAGGDKAVMAWLRLKTAEAFQPDIIVAQNDHMAAGARRAFTTNRPDWSEIPYLGVDGLLRGDSRP